MNVVHEIRSERKRTVRAEAILDAALGVLTSEGLDAVTLGRVAREVDLVPAALYRYFASKDAMLAALQRKVLEDVHGRLRAAREQLDARLGRRHLTPLARLLFLVDFYLALPGVAPGHHHLIVVFLADPRLLLPEPEARKNAPLFAALLAEVEGLLREGAAEGTLAAGDSLQRALILWSSLQGALLIAKLTRWEPALGDPAEIGRAAAQTLLAGWGASSACLRAARKQLSVPPTAASR
jgi:AcrR family transcriptional regulator